MLEPGNVFLVSLAIVVTCFYPFIGFETELINFENPSKRNAGSNFLASTPKKSKFDISCISYQDDALGDPDYTFYEKMDLDASKYEFFLFMTTALIIMLETSFKVNMTLSVKSIVKHVWFRMRNSSAEKNSNSLRIMSVYISCLASLV